MWLCVAFLLLFLLSMLPILMLHSLSNNSEEPNQTNTENTLRNNNRTGKPHAKTIGKQTELLLNSALVASSRDSWGKRKLPATVSFRQKNANSFPYLWPDCSVYCRGTNRARSTTTTTTTKLVVKCFFLGWLHLDAAARNHLHRRLNGVHWC